MPARWGSTRLPGKALADIGGRAMVLHVVDRIREGGFEPVVATDDGRIESACRRAGVMVQRTRADHLSGSDRVHEVSQAYPQARIVVNVQGDEPLFEGAVLAELVARFEDPRVQVATLAAPLSGPDGPSVVKVRVDSHGFAEDFTRSSQGEGGRVGYLQHIGCYAFRRDALALFVSLPPSPRELKEHLEQLRLLEAGVPIAVVQTTAASPSVDTPQDLDRLRALMC